MAARNPIPREALARFDELRSQKTHHLEIGRLLIVEFPERFGEMNAFSVYQACAREKVIHPYDEAIAETKKILPKPVDLPEIVAKIEVPYRDCLLFSDNHLPYHDEEVISEGLAFAKAAKLRRVVLNGDTLDLHWASQYVNLTSEDVGESFEQLGQFFVSLLDAGLEEIYMNHGNHEDRLMRKTGGQLHLWTIVALAIDTLPSKDRIRVRNAVTATNRHYIRFTECPRGIDWIIGHPRRYRKKRMSLSSELATIRGKANVATGHQHHFGITIDESGQYYAVDLPSTQQRDRTEYLEVSIDPGTEPQKGFGWLFDGVPGLWWSEAPYEWKAWTLESAKARARHMKKRETT